LEEVSDPDQADRDPNVYDEQILREFAERYFPDGAGPTMTLRACLFTNTPDHHFIIDLHPDYPQVAFTSPCSGHGFKFASVLGEIMADLAERGETRHNIELFRMERFEGRPRAGSLRRPLRQSGQLAVHRSYRLPRQVRRVGDHRARTALYEPRDTYSVVAEEAEDTIRPFW
jgi:sarcosine oxidase